MGCFGPDTWKAGRALGRMGKKVEGRWLRDEKQKRGDAWKAGRALGRMGKKVEGRWLRDEKQKRGGERWPGVGLLGECRHESSLELPLSAAFFPSHLLSSGGIGGGAASGVHPQIMARGEDFEEGS